MTEFELRNYGSAIACFESALSSRVRALGPGLRKQTEHLLKRARRFVARVHLELQPGTASVLIDGALMQVPPGSTLLLSVGEHTIEVRADAYLSTQRTINVQGGEEQVLEVVLSPVQRPGARKRPRQAGPRRYAGGVHLSALAATQGYARQTPGLGLDLGFWSEQFSWALDARLGIRVDVSEPQRDYFQVPLELAGYRLLPIANHALLFGLGTGLTYVNERIELTQTIGDFVMTRAHTVISDRTLGFPLLARAGVLLFRSSSVSLLASADYSFTFIKLKDSAHEQAVRLHLGLLFGRSRT